MDFRRLWKYLIQSGSLPWALALGIFVLGMGDLLIWDFFGIEMALNGQDATLLVTVYFAVNLSILGYLLGRLLISQNRIEGHRQTIESQLEALETHKELALENEKLAAIGRLSAGVAHEVRNPLAVIKAAANLIGSDLEADSEAEQAAIFIGDEVDRLNDFVTTLLDFSKPVKMQNAYLSLDEVFSAAHILARDRLQTHHIDLKMPQSPLPYRVLGDNRQLTQLVLNLLLNAQQAMEKEGVIEIRHRAEGSFLYLEVVDSGPGVKETDIPHLFEPFFTTKSSGTGLGLAMAQRIARLHQGQLHYRANQGLGPQGQGACFELVLPNLPLPPAQESLGVQNG